MPVPAPRHSYHLRRAALLLATCAVASSTQTMAAPTPPADERPLEHVFVSAGAPAPGDQLVQAAQIDLLDGVEKSLRQRTSLGQTLQHMAGVRVIDTGNNAGVPVIRGLSGNRIRILSNGIGVDYQQYGLRHQPNIDPYLSDRIEVVRGAASVLYGSDAMGGVIDVHGLDLGFSSDDKRRNRVGGRLGYASNNEQQDIALRADSTGQAFSIAAGIARRSGDNIETADQATAFVTGDGSDPAFTGALPFTDFDQRNAQLALGWKGDQSSHTLRLTRWDNEQNYLLPALPGGAGIGVDLENTELQWRSDYQFSHQQTSWTLRPTLAWQNNKRQANRAGNPRSALFDGTVDNEFDQYTLRLEALHTEGSLFDRGTIGIELRHRDEESRGTSVLTPGGEVSAIGVFAYQERQFNLLLLQAGLRFEHIETVGDADKTAAALAFDGRISNRHDVLSGAIGASYPLSDALTLAANIASGFRAPSIFELFASGVHGGVAAVQQGNAALEPEQSLNIDLALRWRSARFSGAVTLYQNRIDDYIYLSDSGRQAPNGLPVFLHEQADATLRGLEAEFRLAINERWSLRMVLDLVDSDNRRSGSALPMTPANELLSELSWRPSGLFGLHAPYARAGLRYTASQQAAPGEPFQQFDRNPRFGSASTDSYWLLDVAVGADFSGPFDRPLRVDLAVHNALDEAYRDFLHTYKGYALNPGRNVRLSLEMPL